MKSPIQQAAAREAQDANQLEGEEYPCGYVAGLNAKIEKYEAILTEIADSLKDGELDAAGEPYDMPNDDAVDALHSFISMAREALGQPIDRPDEYTEEES